MRTSNKIIISALLLIVVALFGYDYQLKQEYFSGRYKNPYRDFATLNYSGFDAVNVKSTSAVNVKFVQGPFKVMADTNMLKNIIISQNGRRLTIAGTFKQNENYNINPYLVYISCPRLKEVNADAVFTSNDKQVVDTTFHDDWNMRQNLVEGFNEDSLTLNQNFGSGIILSKNHIKVLTATVGSIPESGAKITILNNNNIQQASLNILNRSRLLLEGQSVQNLQYHLDDSAKMILTGAAQKILSNAKSYHK